jgi:2-(1,2-epoxy-1,2-dihydrophenyl)acetyl-CoA isomerase
MSSALNAGNFLWREQCSRKGLCAADNLLGAPWTRDLATGVYMDQHLIEAISDGVAKLTFNRPERLNALSTPIMEGLLEALPRLARDPTIGAIVLTGAGRAFCAGGDVKSMAEGLAERDVEEAVIHLRERMEVSRLLHEIPKPTIAMVNGPAAGAGMSLALACDLRIAAQSARFVTAFANIGFSGDFGGSYFLSKIVGTGKARELYYTAEPLDASQALALGVVNRVVPDAALVDTTMLLARKLAHGPRVALARMKQNFNAAENGTFAELLDLEARNQIETGRTDDHKEAARAFVEKRPPVFTGR